jgi:transposase
LGAALRQGSCEGLKDGKAPGQPSLLKDEHRRALAQKIEDGPNPAADGVVRWRLIDLAQWIFEDYRISVTKQILSRELRAMGLSQALGTAAPSCPGRRRCGRF